MSEQVTVHELATAVWCNLDNLRRDVDVMPAKKWDEQWGLVLSTIEEIAEMSQ